MITRAHRIASIPRSLVKYVIHKQKSASFHSLSSSSSFFPSHRSSLNASKFLTSSPHRSLFIQTQQTPNPNALKFLPGRDVLGVDGGTVDFTSLRSAVNKSPLASALFQIDGVKGVLLAGDFISVNIEEGQDWNIIKPSVYAAIMDFYATGQSVLKEATTLQSPAITSTTASSIPLSPEDEEVVIMIKELLETRIRPAVQEDGGDISFISFTPSTGIVHVQMQGSCKGCSSSTITLKNGIENMLMHYVPEVKGVEEWKDEELEAVSNDQLNQLEQGLANIKQHQQQQHQQQPAAY